MKGRLYERTKYYVAVTITIHREEIENLQDLLLQTGKDKEDLIIKVTKGQKRMQNLEKENMKLDQENKYFKSENKKNNEYINKLNLEYQQQMQDITKKDKENDNVIKILKDQLFRQGAVTSESGAGGISSPKPPQVVEQETPEAPRSTTAQQAATPVADLEISLAILTVSQETSQPAPGHNSQPATQDTSETILQEAPREAPGDTSVQVDECVQNIQCAENCEHIGCRIVKCEECSFTTDNKKRLEIHIKEKHRITCFTCKDTFRTFSEMIEHRRLNHPSTKKCANFPNCERGEQCLYRHEDATNDINIVNSQAQGAEGHITCRICLSEFHDKNEMMIHRKSEHLSRVGICKNIEAGLICRKGPDHCWYQHNMMNSSRSTLRNNTTVPVFNVENFPHGPTPQGGVVGQNNMQFQIIQQTLQAQQQQMALMM